MATRRQMNIHEKAELDFIRAYEALCKKHKRFVGKSCNGFGEGLVCGLTSSSNRIHFQYQIALLKNDVEYD